MEILLGALQGILVGALIWYIYTLRITKRAYLALHQSLTLTLREAEVYKGELAVEFLKLQALNRSIMAGNVPTPPDTQNTKKQLLN